MPAIARERYRVINKLDSGGMAEVFLGEAESLQGFKKLVAIKRVLPHLAQNAEFLAMFLDEARLSLRFNNANVVQTFDLGHSDNTYFIVMEYVDGTNLKKVMEFLRARNEILPIEFSVFIVIGICRGLAYAHGFRDQEGRLLGIVHRDVSPPNILLSKQGEIKIVDFGLAKATSQLETTDPGVVKGKFAYLSPEVAKGKEADFRADIFACGIIIFELLTGRRLFLGENDVHTVELVRRADVPSPSSINPQIPQSLEQIVKKSLSLNPEDRFQGCNELAEVLAGFLFEYGRRVTSFDLQRLVDRVMAVEPKKKVAKPSIIDRLIQEEIGRFSSLEDDDSSVVKLGGNRGNVGAAPLDPTGFEDPREWAGELPRDSHDSPLPTQQQPSEWRESGLSQNDSPPNGFHVSELSSLAPPPDEPNEEFLAPSLAQILEGEGRVTGDYPPVKETTNKLSVIIVGIITGAAIGVAVAAYVLGWIP